MCPGNNNPPLSLGETAMWSHRTLSQGCLMLQLCDIIRTVPVISPICHCSWWFPLKDAISITSFQPLLLFSHSDMSNSLQPHGWQHARLPSPSQYPGVCSNSCPIDAIQPSHPLPSPSPPAFSLSQHQGVFQWVRPWHQAAKVLELQLQHQSFQWIVRTDFL